jgi:hypothetical protein
MDKYIVVYIGAVANFPPEIRLLSLNQWKTYQEVARLPAEEAKVVANLILSCPYLKDKASIAKNKTKAPKKKNLRTNRK